MIQTEPGSNVYQDGYPISGFDEYGFVNWTVGLIPSEIGIEYATDSSSNDYYLIPEENYFPSLLSMRLEIASLVAIW